MAVKLEDILPTLYENGINSNEAVDFSGSTGTFKTPTGTNTIGGNVASSGNITFDFSGSTGTFKTSSGVNTMGGAVATKVSALTSSATIALNAALGNVFTLTAGHTATINATGGTAGQMLYIVVLTSGTNSYTLTFGTAFKTTGTLATGSSDAKTFAMTFINDGTNFVEVARTTAM